MCMCVSSWVPNHTGETGHPWKWISVRQPHDCQWVVLTAVDAPFSWESSMHHLRWIGSYLCKFDTSPCLSHLLNHVSNLARCWPGSMATWQLMILADNLNSFHHTVGHWSTLRQCVSFCMWEDVNGLVSPKTPKCTGSAVNSKIKYTGGFWPVSARWDVNGWQI